MTKFLKKSLIKNKGKFSLSFLTNKKYISKISKLINEEDKINEATKSVNERKSKKKKISNLLFFLFNIVVVAAILWYQLSKETVTSLSDIKNFKLFYLPIIILIFFTIMLLDTHRTNLFLRMSGNRSRPALCYKMCAIGKYYDNITPMSTGGEPSQIFYMNHRGLDASSSISVPMGRYVVSQMAWIIVGIFAVTMIAVLGVMDVSAIMIVGLVGFFANFFILSLCLFLSMNKKVGNKIVKKTLKFLQKIKVVKNYDKQYDRVNGVVVNYQSTMKTYAKRKWLFAYTVFISILIFVLTYTMPYVIYLMLGGTDYSMWLNMLVFSLIIDLASSIIPIPGGTGMNEISFSFVYESIFPNGTVFWGLLIWRFMTYYIFIIQGILIVIYDYFIGDKRYLWLKKKWELEEESVNFQQEQIKNYKKKKRIKKEQ